MIRPKIVCDDCRWFANINYDCNHETNIRYDYRGNPQHTNKASEINGKHDCPNFEKKLPLIERIKRIGRIKIW